MPRRVVVCRRVAAKLGSDERAVVGHERRFVRRNRAWLMHREVESWIRMLQQRERLCIPTDPEILIDDVEDAVGVGTEMGPQLWVGLVELA